MAFNFEITAERKIQEAIEEGVFDNVPGKGLPLNLDFDPAIPPELRAAHRILKNANAAPDWVQLNQAIRDLLTDCTVERTGFQQGYSAFRSKLLTSPSSDANRIHREFVGWYRSTVDGLKSSMCAANFSIQKYNLIAPTCTHNHIPFRVDEEIDRLTSSYPCPNGSDS